MKQFNVWFPTVAALLILAAIFLFRNDLNSFVSNQYKKTQGTTKQDSIRQRLQNSYNYSVNKEKFQYTFLEFGSIGCLSCQKMEGVMQEIKTRYPDQVKVVFINVAQKENQELTQYFGISTIPSQVLLDRKGSEYYRHTGYISAQDLEKNFK